MMRRLLLAASVTAACGTASAQENSDSAWGASLELGAVATTGNTETVSVQGKADVRQETQNWQNEYIATLLFKDDEVRLADGTTRSERTAERYYLSAKSAYKLDRENSNLFVFASHTDDRFGAYEEYTTASFGYGGRWIDREDMHLDYEIGPGYFRGERASVVGANEVEQGFIVRGAGEFQWQFSDTAKFAQSLSVETGADNTRTISDTSVSTKVSDSLQMKVGYSVFYNSNVAPGKEPTDTTTFLTLVYDI